ncbi:hypothetical protein [Catenulispora subtropica]|uniref:Uncharacterized protein n=1 Tax=Catenulispora subtropica TaxID=450798 RepID=A0ABN2T5K8_9ACTN
MAAHRSGQNLVALRTRNTTAPDAGLVWRPFACDPPRRRFVLVTPADSLWAGMLTGGAGVGRAETEMTARRL